MLMFWWCVGIAIVVFGFMIYSMVHFRKSAGAVADVHLTAQHAGRGHLDHRAGADPDQHGGAGGADAGADRGPTGSQLTIRVTGYQWKWGYEYVGTGVTVLSTLARAAIARASSVGHRSVHGAQLPAEVDHPLVVPAGVKVRLLITGQDVIHSWWVPALRDQEGCDPGLHQRGLV